MGWTSTIRFTLTTPRVTLPPAKVRAFVDFVQAIVGEVQPASGV